MDWYPLKRICFLRDHQLLLFQVFGFLLAGKFWLANSFLTYIYIYVHRCVYKTNMWWKKIFFLFPFSFLYLSFLLKNESKIVMNFGFVMSFLFFFNGPKSGLRNFCTFLLEWRQKKDGIEICNFQLRCLWIFQVLRSDMVQVTPFAHTTLGPDFQFL